MEQPETLNAGLLDPVVGQRVEIANGAWKGEAGTVRAFIPENGCLRVMLDSGIQLAWGASELRKLPNAPGERLPGQPKT